MPGFADPLDLFRAAVAAANADDWAGAAALCDPVSLRAFHRELVAQFAPPAPRREFTVDEYLRYAPDTPRDVAEYLVAQHRRLADPAERLLRELPGVADAAALAALGPAEAFAAWLDGRSVRRQVERLAAEGQLAHAAGAPREDYRYEPLGAVPDGARVAHVLFRDRVEPDQPWPGEAGRWLAGRPADEQALARELWGRGHPQVATCLRQPDGSWLLVADHDFLRISSRHVAGVAADPDAGADGAQPERDAGAV